mmetsp:Transcript_29077/g.55917  ORF Transcript_29077/g.55917 Transcript_29077/m.55917 type:complete len:548 (-) Transcript_29077:255-1898(-)
MVPFLADLFDLKPYAVIYIIFTTLLADVISTRQTIFFLGALKPEGGVLGAIYVIYADLVISITIVIVFLPIPLLAIDRITSPPEIGARLVAASSIDRDATDLELVDLINNFYGSDVIALKYHRELSGLAKSSFANLDLQFFRTDEISEFEPPRRTSRGYQTDFWSFATKFPSIYDLYGVYSRNWNDDRELGYTLYECVLDRFYEKRYGRYGTLRFARRGLVMDQGSPISLGPLTEVVEAKKFLTPDASPDVGSMLPDPAVTSLQSVLSADDHLDPRGDLVQHLGFPWIEWQRSATSLLFRSTRASVECSALVRTWIYSEFSKRVGGDDDLFAAALSSDTGIEIKSLSNETWHGQNLSGFGAVFHVKFDWREYDQGFSENYLSILEHISFFSPRFVNVAQLRSISTNTNEIRKQQLANKNFSLRYACLNKDASFSVSHALTIDEVFYLERGCVYGVAVFDRMTYHIKKGVIDKNDEFTTVPLFPIGLSALFMTFVTYTLVGFTFFYISVFGRLRSSLLIRTRYVDRYFFLGYVLCLLSFVTLGLGLSF